MRLTRLGAASVVLLVAAQGVPACSSQSQPEDAGAAICSVVVPSDDERSCTVDSDCVEVAQVPSCPAGASDYCNGSAVNQRSAAHYNAVLRASLASVPSDEVSSCFCDGGFAICRAGKCEVDGCEPAVADTLQACVAAGGTCFYSQSASCEAGPPDACAYGDEVCCLR